MMKPISILLLGALLVVVSCSDNPTESTDPIEEPSPTTESFLECVDGESDGQYSCSNIDLLAKVSFDKLPVQPLANGVAFNDIWGWTDPQTGKEYALVGRVDGTSFVD